MRKLLIAIGILLASYSAFAQPVRETSPSSITSLVQRGMFGKDLYLPKVRTAPSGTPASITGGVDSVGAEVFCLADSLTYLYVGGGNWIRSTPSVSGKVNYTDTSSMLSPYQRATFAVKYADTASMLSYYYRSNNPSGYITSSAIAGKVNYTDTATMLNGYYRSTNPAGYITSAAISGKLNVSDTAAMNARNTLAYVLNNGNIGYKSIYIGNTILGSDTISFNGTGPITITTSNTKDVVITTNNLRVNDYATYFTGAGGVIAPYYVTNYYSGIVFDGGTGVTNVGAAFPGVGANNRLVFPAKSDTIATKGDIISKVSNYVTKNTVDTIVSSKNFFSVLDFGSISNVTKYGVIITPNIINNTTGDIAIALQVNGTTNISSNLIVGTATSSPIVQAQTKIISGHYSSYGNGVLLSNGVIVGGSGYTNGSYTNQTLTSSTGTLTGVYVTVSGGSVTNIIYGSNSSGFNLSDTIRWPAGTGTGFYTLATNVTGGIYIDSFGTTNSFIRFVDKSKHLLINYSNYADTGIYNLDVNGKARINDLLNLPNISTGTAANGLYLDASGNVIKGVTPINLTNLSASSPLAYNNSTGAFSIQQANTSQSGYLSSTDWNTFNGKQSAGNYINNVYLSGTQQNPADISITGSARFGGSYAKPFFWFDSSTNRLNVSATGSQPTSNIGLVNITDSSASNPLTITELGRYATVNVNDKTGNRFQFGYDTLFGNSYISSQSSVPLSLQYNGNEKEKITGNGVIISKLNIGGADSVIPSGIFIAPGNIFRHYQSTNTITNAQYLSGAFTNNEYRFLTQASGTGNAPTLLVGNSTIMGTYYDNAGQHTGSSFKIMDTIGATNNNSILGIKQLIGNLTGSSGTQILSTDYATINQTSSAGYILHRFLAYEQGTGGGVKKLSSWATTNALNGAGSITEMASIDNAGNGLFAGSVGVGSVSSNNASAALQVTSTTQGFRPPTMTTTQQNAITSPATGLQVYNTTNDNPSYYAASIGGTAGWAGYQPITKVVAAATTGTVTATLNNVSVWTVTPTGAITFNASGGVAGQEATLVVTTSGTTAYTITFGTNFKTTGTLSTGTVSGKVFTVGFVYDGTNWNEKGRTTAM